MARGVLVVGFPNRGVVRAPRVPGAVTRREILGKSAGIFLMGKAVSAGFPGILRIPRQAFSYNDPIAFENVLPGSSDWEYSKRVTSEYEVSGYVFPPSVQAGEEVVLRFNVRGPNVGRDVAVDVFRLGWYDGVGARRIAPRFLVQAGSPREVPPARENGLIECADWPVAIRIPTEDNGASWPSGIYLFRLMGSDGRASYAPFVVRDQRSSAPYLLLLGQDTWHGYNEFGGNSLYSFGSRYSNLASFRVGPKVFWSYYDNILKRSVTSPVHPGASSSVSLARPFSFFAWGAPGAGELFRFEYRLVRFLERRGFPLNYASSFDMGSPRWDSGRAISHPVRPEVRTIILSGHTEYWSAKMRDALAKAQTEGVGIVNFGANNVYWNGRLEAGDGGKIPSSVYTCWKGTERDGTHAKDPLREDPTRASALFRSPHMGQPEQLLLGAMFDGWLDRLWGRPAVGKEAFGHQPLRFVDTLHPVFAGTGLENGDEIPVLCGGEFDRVFDSVPRMAGTQIVAETEVPRSRSGRGDVTVQQSVLVEGPVHDGKNVRVFNAGTFNWNWGLDNFSFDRDAHGVSRYISTMSNPYGVEKQFPRAGIADSRIQRLTENILRWAAREE